MFLIQQGQTSEEQLEQKKHELDELKKKCDFEIGKLRTGEEDIKERIIKNETEKTFLLNTTQDEQNKVIDPVTFSNVD